MLGKKAAATLLGKGAVTAATTATTTTAATATTATTATAATTSTAATAGGIGVAGATGIVAGVGLLASGLGEGIFQLTKMGDGFVDFWQKTYDSKKWWDPRKSIDFGILQIMKVLNLGLGNLGVLLDIVGAPFRYLVELVRYPFLDESGKAKQRKNLAKFDARIRDQFRKTLNFFTFGLGFKEEGSFGSLYGKEGTEGMGYNDKEKNDKKDKKDKTISDSIKYSVKEGKVDPDSLEEGVSLKKAQQHYLESQIKILEFKVRSSKRRYGKDANTSAMEKKLNNLKSRFNATLDYGGYDIKGNV